MFISTDFPCLLKYLSLLNICGTRCWWHSWLWHCATSKKVTGSIPNVVIRIFHWLSFRPHCDTWLDSASSRNEYQEYFLDSKGGRCVGLTILPPPCADCLEILDSQPSGPFQTCTGSALPLPLLNVHIWMKKHHQTVSMASKTTTKVNNHVF